MTKEIKYNLHDLSIALLRADDDGSDLAQLVYDDSVSMLTEDYKRLYNALVSGEIDYFRHGEKTVYVFTRSARPGVAVQRSVFWERSGEFIPVSHSDIYSFEDMTNSYNHFCIDNVTVNYGFSSDFA